VVAVCRPGVRAGRWPQRAANPNPPFRPEVSKGGRAPRRFLGRKGCKEAKAQRNNLALAFASLRSLAPLRPRNRPPRANPPSVGSTPRVCCACALQALARHLRIDRPSSKCPACPAASAPRANRRHGSAYGPNALPQRVRRSGHLHSRAAHALSHLPEPLARHRATTRGTKSERCSALPRIAHARRPVAAQPLIARRRTARGAPSTLARHAHAPSTISGARSNQVAILAPTPRVCALDAVFGKSVRPRPRRGISANRTGACCDIWLSCLRPDRPPCGPSRLPYRAALIEVYVRKVRSWRTNRPRYRSCHLLSRHAHEQRLPLCRSRWPVGQALVLRLRVSSINSHIVSGVTAVRHRKPTPRSMTSHGWVADKLAARLRGFRIAPPAARPRLLPAPGSSAREAHVARQHSRGSPRATARPSPDRERRLRTPAMLA